MKSLSVQVVLSASAALLSAIFWSLEYRLLLWRQRGIEVVGDQIWNELRRFSGWMFAGCVAGSVAMAARLQGNFFRYESQIPERNSRKLYYELRGPYERFFVATEILYPLMFLCAMHCMCMVLIRVSDHTSHSYYNQARDYESGRTSDGGRFDLRDFFGEYFLYRLVRRILKLVALLCALAMLARFISAGFRTEAASLYDRAAAACDAQGKETPKSETFHSDALLFRQKKDTAAAVARLIESVVLSIMVLSFLIFFPICIAMFRRVALRLSTIINEMDLRPDNGDVFLPYEFSPEGQSGCGACSTERAQISMQAGKARAFLKTLRQRADSQSLRYSIGLLLILLALIAYLSLALFVAVIQWDTLEKAQHEGGITGCGACDVCQDVKQLMVVWYNNNPELYPLFTSICLVLPLMFAIMLMVTKKDLELMLNPHNFCPDAVALRLIENSSQQQIQQVLTAEASRMGIELQ
jgi:hypothetical protein